AALSIRFRNLSAGRDSVNEPPGGVRSPGRPIVTTYASAALPPGRALLAGDDDRTLHVDLGRIQPFEAGADDLVARTGGGVIRRHARGHDRHLPVPLVDGDRAGGTVRRPHHVLRPAVV